MKLNRSILCALTAMAFITLTPACSKSSNSNTSGGTLSATIGSSVFTAGGAAGFYSQSLGLMGVVGYTIQSKDTTTMEVEFPYPPVVNHPVSSDSIAELGISYTAAGKEYDGYLGSGRCIITLTTADTINHKLTGTFSGVAYNASNRADSLVITNGKFSSSYTVSP
jgi:hypothetical protein